MDRLISKKQVKEIVGFGLAHIDRMENDPAYTHLGFPKRVRIGFRVFWVEEEVYAWVAKQIAKRDASQPTKERSAGSTFRNPVQTRSFLIGRLEIRPIKLLILLMPPCPD